MIYIKKIIKAVPRSLLFQIILTGIFIIPLIETLGQYISSGFITQKTGVPILFWPGVKYSFSIRLSAWIPIGIMSISYVVGVFYMVKKKIFGEAMIIGFIGSNIIGNELGCLINHFTGWTEHQQQFSYNFSGVIINHDYANMSIFSYWHNPIWEEVVFRGIPLIILMFLKNRLSDKSYKYAEILYILVPSIMFAVYHVPNHGPSRIVDTFIFGCVCAYLTLKYSFFAPLILHCMEDARGILNIVNSNFVPQNQVVWLSENYNLLRNINNIFYQCLGISIILIIVWNIIKLKKAKSNDNSIGL